MTDFPTIIASDSGDNALVVHVYSLALLFEARARETEQRYLATSSPDERNRLAQVPALWRDAAREIRAVATLINQRSA